jgi:hypothetical protein
MRPAQTFRLRRDEMGEHADDALNAIMERGWGFRGGRSRSRGSRGGKAVAARRIMAHNAFDPIWKNGEMTRTEAYAWLAEQLGINRGACHMEQMDVAMCDRVIEICTRRGFADLIK